MLLLLVSCSKSNQNHSSITGQTKEIKDGTWLYLKDSYKDILLDSTIVKNNTFKITSDIDSLPIDAFIYSKDFKHFKFLWLEDKEMTFDSRNTSFDDGIVSGKLNTLQAQLRSSYKGKSRPERRKIEKQFIKDNPNSIISANMLSTYKTTFGKAVIVDLFNNFSKENKNSVYGKSIEQYIALNNGDIKIGDTFIDFEMNDINGKKRSLSDVKSTYTLLEFWASSCAPCRQENPNLVKTYNTYKDKGFEIFAVSEDIKKQNWIRAIKKDKLPWIHVSDLNKSNKASMIYDINGIPDNFLIDENGIIIARNLRGEKLNETLSKLLN